MSVEYDAISLEILWSRLIALVDEAAATLVRSAFSNVIRDSNDYSNVLLSPRGESLAQNTGCIPSFVATSPMTMRHFLRKFPAPEWQPGDAVITNDPWLGSGHIPDMTMAMPIFRKGRLVGFSSSVAHMADIGGLGSVGEVRSIFEEGLHLLPCKFVQRGELNTQLVEIISANVRVPEQVIGDLLAMRASCEMCGRKLVEFMEDEGIDDIVPLSVAIHDVSEKAMRRGIEKAPDGVYEHVLETDGFDEPLQMHVKVTIKGGNVEVDLAGTSKEVNRGINSPMNYTTAYAMYALKVIFDPLTPQNEGSFRPIRVEAPSGTILSCRFPAATYIRHVTTHFLPMAIFGALADAMPEHVIGDSASPSVRSFWTGVDKSGRAFAILPFLNGGMGARYNADGESCVNFPSNTAATPVEVVENLGPLLVLEKELIQDSGGPGKYRGGCGQRVSYQLLSEHPALIHLYGDRVHHPCLGIGGGLPGSHAKIELSDGRLLHPKRRYEIQPGQVTTLSCPGGGGYGPPEERELGLILDDLRNGIISPEAAKEIYKVEARSKKD